MIKGVIVVVLLGSMYTYMYIALKEAVNKQNKDEYHPNLKRSALELIAFLTVYFACSVVSVESTLPGLVVTTLVAFVVSFAVFNKFHYEMVGAYMVVMATGITSSWYYFAPF